MKNLDYLYILSNKNRQRWIHKLFELRQIFEMLVESGAQLVQIQSQHFSVLIPSLGWTVAYLQNTILERVSKLSDVKSYETY